jgi:hypothetical protein
MERTRVKLHARGAADDGSELSFAIRRSGLLRLMPGRCGEAAQSGGVQLKRES